MGKVKRLVIMVVLFVVIYHEICRYIPIVCVLDSKQVDVKGNFAHWSLTSKRHFTKLLSNFSCDSRRLLLLIVVTSNVINFERRETIRRFWGSSFNTLANNDYRTFFTVSKSRDKMIMQRLKEEVSIHKDLILTDMFEDFYSLSYKVEAQFEWAYRYCDFDYLLKADDDVYVNLRQLFLMLNSAELPKSKLYLGYHHHNPHVMRKGKYNVSLNEYASNCYPDYCAGGAVVFSRDLVVNMIPYITSQPLKIDDAYIGILVRNADATPFHSDRFQFFTADCHFNPHLVAHHPVKTKICMEKIHFGMLATHNEEEFVRKHYLS